MTGGANKFKIYDNIFVSKYRLALYGLILYNGTYIIG